MVNNNKTNTPVHFNDVESYATNIPELAKVCTADKSGGIDIFVRFQQKDESIFMEIQWNNVSCVPSMSSLTIQLNKNAFGLSPSSQQITCNPSISTGCSGLSRVELIVGPSMLSPIPINQSASSQVQVAIKNMTTSYVFYFATNFDISTLFSSDGALERTAFIEAWKSIDDKKELYGSVSNLPANSVDVDSVCVKFALHNIFFIARQPVPNAEGQEVVYFSMKTLTNMKFFCKLTFKNGVNACKICVKTESSNYATLTKNALEIILKR